MTSMVNNSVHTCYTYFVTVPKVEDNRVADLQQDPQPIAFVGELLFG
jgi:hypothetical protein